MEIAFCLLPSPILKAGPVQVLILVDGYGADVVKANPGRAMGNSNSENWPYSYLGWSINCHKVSPNHSQGINGPELGF